MFKECPFCLNDNQDDKTIQCHKNGEYFEAEVQCDQCDCVGPFMYMAKSEEEAKTKAVEFWNSRRETKLNIPVLTEGNIKNKQKGNHPPVVKGGINLKPISPPPSGSPKGQGERNV